MNRKRYMREVYPKHWLTARERIYGIFPHENNLCEYICAHVPRGGRLLEVAIGTGYPNADFLQRAGYQVSGTDISPELVEKCKESYPQIDCRVGDAESLEYDDDSFDATYCFNSTLYFPNLYRSIDEMVRVTRPGGLVIFDTMNRDNQEINAAYEKYLTSTRPILSRIMRATQRIAKIALGRNIADWNFLVHQVPTYSFSIFQHFRKRQIRNFEVMGVLDNGSTEITHEYGALGHYRTLIFVVKKE